MNLDEVSIVTYHSFVVLSALLLRALLVVSRIEGISGLANCIRINGYIIVLKLAESTDDNAISESLIVLLLTATTQNIFF